MISALNSVTVNSSTSAKPAERPDPEQLFKQLDSGGKGYLTADDLQAVVVKISAEGAKRASGSGSTPSAQDLVQRLDADKDGKVSETEFKAGAPKAPSASEARQGEASAPAQASAGGAAHRAAAPGGGAGGGAGGAAPSGGTGGAGKAAAGGSASAAGSTTSSSSSTTYEPADTNEDGKVSTEEQQAYDKKVAEQRAQASGQTRSKEADVAINTYESVAGSAA